MSVKVEPSRSSVRPNSMPGPSLREVSAMEPGPAATVRAQELIARNSAA